VDVPHLPRILGAEVFEPDGSERLTVGVAMGLGVSVTGGGKGDRMVLGEIYGPTAWVIKCPHGSHHPTMNGIWSIMATIR